MSLWCRLYPTAFESNYPDIAFWATLSFLTFITLSCGPHSVSLYFPWGFVTTQLSIVNRSGIECWLPVGSTFPNRISSNAKKLGDNDDILSPINLVSFCCTSGYCQTLRTYNQAQDWWSRKQQSLLINGSEDGLWTSRFWTFSVWIDRVLFPVIRPECFIELASTRHLKKISRHKLSMDLMPGYRAYICTIR